MAVDLYDSLKEKVIDTIDTNYDELLGFLQKFYSLCVVLNVLSKDEEIKSELNIVSRKYFDEIFDYHVKEILSLNIDNFSTKQKNVIFTFSIISEYFPEFCDGSFDFNYLNEEQIEATSILFKDSTAYTESTTKFKSTFDNSIKKHSLDRSNYKEVPFALNLSNGKKIKI